MAPPSLTGSSKFIPFYPQQNSTPFIPIHYYLPGQAPNPTRIRRRRVIVKQSFTDLCKWIPSTPFNVFLDLDDTVFRTSHYEHYQDHHMLPTNFADFYCGRDINFPGDKRFLYTKIKETVLNMKAKGAKIHILTASAAFCRMSRADIASVMDSIGFEKEEAEYILNTEHKWQQISGPDQKESIESFVQKRFFDNRSAYWNLGPIICAHTNFKEDAAFALAENNTPCLFVDDNLDVLLRAYLRFMPNAICVLSHKNSQLERRFCPAEFL